MHSFSFTAILMLAASFVTAAPTAEVATVQLEARQYPTVANVEAVMGEVDVAYLEKLKSVVINLDGSASAKRDLQARQGACAVQGFAIVNGQLTPFQGNVANPAANFGRPVTLTGILPGCSVGIIPQSDCSLYSIIDTSGCATSRSVSFS